MKTKFTFALAAISWLSGVPAFATCTTVSTNISDCGTQGVGINTTNPTDRLSVIGNFDADNIYIGRGAFGTFASANVPNASLSAIIPQATLSTGPALTVERNTTGGNPNNIANPTLFIGTHLNAQSPSSWTWGTYSALQIDHNAAPNGNGAYGEAMRADCNIAATIDQSMTCWGAVFRSTSDSSSKSTFNIGVESEVVKNISDAPEPPLFNSTWFNASFVAGAGISWATGTGYTNDAGFIVNNWTTRGGFQTGFDCPKETTSNYNIRHSCLYAASTSKYGIDLLDGHWNIDAIVSPGFSVDGSGNLQGRSEILNGAAAVGLQLQYGTWSTSQIQARNYSVDPNGNTWGASFAATAAPIPTYANQVSYGGNSSTNKALCGNLTGAAGCVQINVAGTMRWMPFY
jgi:hypothetical protein